MLAGIKGKLGMLGLVAVLLLMLKAGLKVSAFIENSEALSRDNKELTVKLAETKESLRVSISNNNRLVAEQQRLKAVKDTYRRQKAEQALEIEKNREKVSDENSKIKATLQRAGVGHVPVPDDVVRMQRERARSINADATRRAIH